MGTFDSGEIPSVGGGEYGGLRGGADYVERLGATGRRPVERSTDYRTKRPISVAGDDDSYGPALGPRADGTPMLPAADEEPVAADD